MSCHPNVRVRVCVSYLGKVSCDSQGRAILDPGGIQAIRCYEGGIEEKNRCLVKSRLGRKWQHNLSFDNGDFPMAAVQHQFSGTVQGLYIAFELGWDTWRLAFGTGLGDNSRQRQVAGRN